MIDISFTYADLEFFLLILVRVTCFVHVAPLFGMTNTVPRQVKIGLSIFIAYFLFFYLDHNEVVYNTLFEYTVIILKEVLTGFLIGWGWLILFFEIGFLCVALTVLEPTL